MVENELIIAWMWGVVMVSIAITIVRIRFEYLKYKKSMKINEQNVPS